MRAASQAAALGPEFFDRSVHDVARDLIGCELAVEQPEGLTAGVIVETEAYEAAEPACHAHVGLTERTAPLFGPPGLAYVYLSYGIHSLLNAVAEPEGSAAAVLIRALEPTRGLELMRERRGRDELAELCSGPGKLTEALGVGLELNEAPLYEPPFRVSPRAAEWRRVEIVSGPRIGITKATELPWRHCAAGNRFLSAPRPG